MPDTAPPRRTIGRYALYGEIAAGGMATVHLGRLSGPAGFSRTVAIKRLHSELARDPDFAAMLLDEARLAARIAHPNVVGTLDVVAENHELFLIMEFVQGESLARLLRVARKREDLVPPSIAAGIAVGVLHGLHAAHEAKSERGDPLGLVHRDVSPQNVLLGRDGIPRVIDFGVAKAEGRAQTTREGKLKGKLAYMAPEQLEGRVDRRSDVYAAAVVLWEMLTSERLFRGDNEGEVVRKVIAGAMSAPSTQAPGIPPSLDEVVLRALSHDPDQRFATARDMARAIEEAITVAGASRIGEWVEELARDELDERAARVASIEGGPTDVTSTTPDRAREPTGSRSHRLFAALMLIGGAVVVVALTFGARRWLATARDAPSVSMPAASALPPPAESAPVVVAPSSSDTSVPPAVSSAALPKPAPMARPSKLQKRPAKGSKLGTILDTHK